MLVIVINHLLRFICNMEAQKQDKIKSHSSPGPQENLCIIVQNKNHEHKPYKEGLYHAHENSVGLSSTTNPKLKGQS